MKAYIVGVFDRKAQAYISLEPTPSIAVTARQFTDAVNNNKESPMHKWPEDFELYELGTWDTESGKVIAHTNDDKDFAPRLIVTASDVKQKNGG